MKYNIPKNTINDWFKDIDKYKNAIKIGKKNYLEDVGNVSC